MSIQTRCATLVRDVPQSEELRTTKFLSRDQVCMGIKEVKRVARRYAAPAG